MKYVRATVDGGVSLDLDPYFDELTRLIERLPPGAAGFVSEPGHFEIGTPTFIKNRQLAGIEVLGESPGSLNLQLALRGNQIQHHDLLVVDHPGLVRWSIHFSRRPRTPYTWRDSVWGLGEVVFHEVLPHRFGTSHEVMFHNGVLKVVSRDITHRYSQI